MITLGGGRQHPAHGLQILRAIFRAEVTDGPLGCLLLLLVKVELANCLLDPLGPVEDVGPVETKQLHRSLGILCVLKELLS